MCSSSDHAAQRASPCEALRSDGSVSGSWRLRPPKEYAPSRIRFGHGISSWPRPPGAHLVLAEPVDERRPSCSSTRRAPPLSVTTAR